MKNMLFARGEGTKIIKLYKKGKLFPKNPEVVMAEAALKKPRGPQLDPNLLIVPKTKAPLCREGTNRYRNQAVILDSKTVGEALDRLRKLPSPGSRKDVEYAVEQDAIELKEPENDQEG